MSEENLLFKVDPAWKETWKGMPGYEHEDLMPWQNLIVNFKNPDDRKRFSELIGQKISNGVKSIWFPEAEIGRMADKKFCATQPLQPKYPIYVISKGRWESRLTAKSLDKIGVPFKIVVEPQEYENYAAVIAPEKILTLPFSNLGQGSIPARNWVWDHAAASRAERHWILDDNIDGFFRFQWNIKTPVGDGTTFRLVEDFSDRYENVGMSGMNYFMFVKRKDSSVPPVTLNTRIYSCILIRNDLPFRWRGRYNEDTDLSLRVLKSGLCTVLFNAFLCMKQTTMTMKGGNSDELYKADGRMKMAQSLQDQHPDIVKITTKWGRPQHHVDYKIFRGNKLILKPGVQIKEGADEYGMERITVVPTGKAAT